MKAEGKLGENGQIFVFLNLGLMYKSSSAIEPFSSLAVSYFSLRTRTTTEN